VVKGHMIHFYVILFDESLEFLHRNRPFCMLPLSGVIGAVN